MMSLTKTLFLSAAAIGLFAASAPAFAQDKKFELTPMVGYRFGGTTSTYGTTYIDSVKVPDALSFGFTAEWAVNPNGTIEFLWSHQDTTLQVNWLRTPPPGYSTDISHLNIDTFQVGGLWQSGRPYDAVRGWLDILVGMSILTPSPQYSSLTRFSASIAGGAKIRFNDAIGAKVGIRWMPIYINSSDAGYTSCDPWYGCYTYYNQNYLYQTDVSAGISFKF